MASPQNVVIFGPTGGVGCAAALEAHARGAHVWLAMRDPAKTIPGIQQNAPGFTRIQADLSKPDSLQQAVQQSGANTAFVYTLFGAQDSMRACFDALKAAGILYIALLSSWMIKGDPADPKNHKGFIDSVHAHTEVALRDAGIQYAAIRPAYFNTNIFMYLDGIKRGELELYCPTARLDYIAPEDIGSVCAGILMNPPAGHELVYLCGPTIHTQYEAIEIIEEALGKDIRTTEVDEQQWKDSLKDKMPAGALDSVAKEFRENVAGKQSYPEDLYKEAVGNILKWKGKSGIELGEWVRSRRREFLG